MFKTVIWATDGSDNADHSLPYVRWFAKMQEVRLLVVHVVQKYASASASGLSVYADEEMVETRLKQRVVAMTEEGLDVTLKLVTHVGPQPAHEIADVAREVEADLIVVGTRGHTPIGGLLLGSVAMRLLHLARCPVLAVPAQSRVETSDSQGEIAHATA